MPKPFGAKDQLEITSLGTQFALCVIIGAAAGYWLDVKFATLPWCLVGGTMAGFAGGLGLVIGAARKANKKNGRF